MTRVVRRDVPSSVTATQPSVWTFLDFEAEDEVAEDEVAEDEVAEDVAQTQIQTQTLSGARGGTRPDQEVPRTTPAIHWKALIRRSASPYHFAPSAR